MLVSISTIMDSLYIIKLGLVAALGEKDVYQSMFPKAHTRSTSRRVLRPSRQQVSQVSMLGAKVKRGVCKSEPRVRTHEYKRSVGWFEGPKDWTGAGSAWQSRANTAVKKVHAC